MEKRLVLGKLFKPSEENSRVIKEALELGFQNRYERVRSHVGASKQLQKELWGLNLALRSQIR